MPLVVTPEDTGMQDSTPIIERIEARHPEPAIPPSAAGQEEFSVELDGRRWTQKPQKYHAKSLRVLREKYAAVTDKGALDPVLQRAGCLAALRG